MDNKMIDESMIYWLIIPQLMIRWFKIKRFDSFINGLFLDDSLMDDWMIGNLLFDDSYSSTYNSLIGH